MPNLKMSICRLIQIFGMIILLGATPLKLAAVMIPEFDNNKIENANVVVIVTPLEISGNCRVDAVLNGQKIKVGDIIKVKSNIIENLDINEYNIELFQVGDPNAYFALYNKQRLCLFLNTIDKSDNSLQIADENYPGFRVCEGTNIIFNGNIKDNIGQLLAENLKSDSIDLIDAGIRWTIWLNSPNGYEEINRLIKLDIRPIPINVLIVVSEIEAGKHRTIKYAVDLLKQCYDQMTSNASASDIWKWYRWYNDIEESFLCIKYTDDAPYLNHLIRSDINISNMLILSACDWADYSSIPILMSSLDERKPDMQYPIIQTLAKLSGRKLVAYEQFIIEPSNAINDWKKWWADEGWPETPYNIDKQ